MEFNKEKFDELANKLYTANNEQATKEQAIKEVAYSEGYRAGYREGIVAVVTLMYADGSEVLTEKSEGKEASKK